MLTSMRSISRYKFEQVLYPRVVNPRLTAEMVKTFKRERCALHYIVKVLTVVVSSCDCMLYLSPRPAELLITAFVCACREEEQTSPSETEVQGGEEGEFSRTEVVAGVLCFL